MQITAPICKSIIFALTVLIFINYWSMVEQPLVFIEDAVDMPLSVILNASKRFRNIAFACGALFSILPILLYQFSYDDLVYGINLTGGVSIEGVEKKAKARTNRQTISKIIVVFMISMGICTLFTQKISYVMTPKVEIVHIRSGDLKSIPSDPTSESLGFYTYIVPTSCIHTNGQDQVIYTIMTEKSRRQRDEAVKMVVKVIETNGMETAIQGGFSQDTKIIARSTKPITDGMIVRVLNNGGADYGD